MLLESCLNLHLFLVLECRGCLRVQVHLRDILNLQTYPVLEGYHFSDFTFSGYYQCFVHAIKLVYAVV